jgi:hypothetical protein
MQHYRMAAEDPEMESIAGERRRGRAGGWAARGVYRGGGADAIC